MYDYKRDILEVIYNTERDVLEVIWRQRRSHTQQQPWQLLERRCDVGTVDLSQQPTAPAPAERGATGCVICRHT